MPDFHVIDDGTNIGDVNAQHNGMCGCLPRREKFGEIVCASAYKDPEDVIPMGEWPKLIQEQEQDESSLWHIWKRSKIGTRDQNPLSYCWCFSSGNGFMLESEVQKRDYQDLSPSSIGAPLVGFRDQGWYIEEALKQMANVGVATTAFVPIKTTRREDFKIGWKESASLNRVTKWRDIEPRNFLEQGSMLLLNRPLVVALNWWSHAVLFLRVLDRYPNLRADDPNRYGILFLNSWGAGYGNNGCGILEGTRKVADAAYAVEQTSWLKHKTAGKLVQVAG